MIEVLFLDIYVSINISHHVTELKWRKLKKNIAEWLISQAGVLTADFISVLRNDTKSKFISMRPWINSTRQRFMINRYNYFQLYIAHMQPLWDEYTNVTKRLPFAITKAVINAQVCHSIYFDSKCLPNQSNISNERKYIFINPAVLFYFAMVSLLLVYSSL